LKTPLNVISSSNQLMSILHKEEIRINQNSLLSNTVKIIKKNTDILMDVINNIMDLSKLELNIYESNKDYYNIVTLVEDTALEFNDYIKLNDIEIFFDTNEEEKRSEEHTSELQSRFDLVCRLLLEKKNTK